MERCALSFWESGVLGNTVALMDIISGAAVEALKCRKRFFLTKLTTEKTYNLKHKQLVFYFKTNKFVTFFFVQQAVSDTVSCKDH